MEIVKGGHKYIVIVVKNIHLKLGLPQQPLLVHILMVLNMVVTAVRIKCHNGLIP